MDGRANYYRSGAGGATTVSLGERLLRRIRITENVSRSNGSTGLSFGGSYQGNKIQFGTDHTMAFVPGQGTFVRVLAVSFSVRLPHSTSVNLATITLPDGTVRHTAWLDTWAYGREAGGQNGGQRKMGKLVVVGRVSTPDGEGVSGAVLKIDGIYAQKNSLGVFDLRFRKSRTVSVAVWTEEFTVGDYFVLDAPDHAQAQPENSVVPISIVVARR